MFASFFSFRGGIGDGHRGQERVKKSICGIFRVIQNVSGHPKRGIYVF